MLSDQFCVTRKNILKLAMENEIQIREDNFHDFADKIHPLNNGI
jgi:hypothetical protein